MVATLFISSNKKDIQIFTSVELEAANHRGGKREKKNIQGGERGGGWGNNLCECVSELVNVIYVKLLG